MNYKIIIGTLLSLVAMACTELPKSMPTTQTIDRFQVQHDVVTDTRSHLMWSRCLLGATWNGISCEGKPSKYSWQQIHNLVRTLNYAGYSDWRVPSFEELKSLADSESSAPMIKISYLNPTVFPMPNCQGAKSGLGLNNDGHVCWHWSSTTIEGSKHYVWIMYFGYGHGSANYEADMFALRLVRNNR